jgi:hypothetical protein
MNIVKLLEDEMGLHSLLSLGGDTGVTDIVEELSQSSSRRTVQYDSCIEILNKHCSSDSTGLYKQAESSLGI